MPEYTDKKLIESTPNELKLKYMIDTQEVLTESSENKKDNDFLNDTLELAKFLDDYNVKNNNSKGGQMGTTPRLYRDLLASLMDLTSGSGDRATPVVLIQNYF